MVQSAILVLITFTSIDQLVLAEEVSTPILLPTTVSSAFSIDSKSSLKPNSPRRTQCVTTNDCADPNAKCINGAFTVLGRYCQCSTSYIRNSNTSADAPLCIKDPLWCEKSEQCSQLDSSLVCCSFAFCDGPLNQQCKPKDQCNRVGCGNGQILP